MFEPCPLNTRKTCSFASSRTYNPDKQRGGGTTNIFCGIATGPDNRVSKLDKCWKDMSASAKKKHRDNYNWDAYR